MQHRRCMLDVTSPAIQYVPLLAFDEGLCIPKSIKHQETEPNSHTTDQPSLIWMENRICCPPHLYPFSEAFANVYLGCVCGLCLMERWQV